MSLAEENKIARELGRELGLAFAGEKFTLASWGQADDYALVRDDVLVLLEVETNQKHPNTNVMKVWPYLEEHPEVTVVLVQVFNTGAKNEKSSRGRLASWSARKIVTATGHRFSYHRLLRDPDGKITGPLAELRALIDQLQARA